jgi:hypothetical protein
LEIPGIKAEPVKVVVSSLGAVVKESLKELASRLEMPAAQTVTVGHKFSDAAILGSKRSWAHY